MVEIYFYLFSEMISQIDQHHCITQSAYAKNNNSLLNMCVGGRYVVIKNIYSSRFGELYEAYDKKNENQRKVVLKMLFISRIKKYSQNQQEMKMRLRYVEEQDKIMRKFDHPNILRWHKTYVNEDFKLIVTKYCNEGTLFNAIQSKNAFDLGHTINALQQISEAVATLHIQRIVHRDLKPGNIFKHNGIYILGDFGISKLMKDDRTEPDTVCGTAYTRAPEIITGRYKLNADIYSIGVIFFIMLCPEDTIEKRGRQAQTMDLKNINFKMINGQYIPQEVKQFLSKSLEPDPAKRMSWMDLRDAPVFKIMEKLKNVTKTYCLRSSVQSIHSLTESLKSLKGSQIFEEGKNYITLPTEQYKENPNFQKVSQTEINNIIIEMDKISDEDTKIYQSFKQFHLWAKIAEYIFLQILLPIDQLKLLNLELQRNVKLMYMISSRCFLFMSRVKSKAYKLPYERFDEDAKYFIKEQIGEIYDKCHDKFLQFGERLSKFENKLQSRIRDTYKSIFESEKYEQENKLFNGIQGFDYKVEQHIEWIQSQLSMINELQTNDISIKSRMKAKFKAFKAITQISLQNIKSNTFQNIVEQFIYRLISQY